MESLHFALIIFGLLTLRSRGTYFLMLTLALSMLVWGVAYQWYDVTGGSNGLAGIKRPDLSIIGLNITTPLSFFYFTLFFFVVATLLMYYITTGSSFGRRLTGIKSNELRMRTLGYNVWFHLNVANFFAGLFAGLAGWLFVYLNSFVSPPILHLTTSAQVLLMTILGGAGTLFGPLFGAIIIIFLQDFMTSYIDRWTMIFGIIYILVIIFIPRGVYVLLQETIPQLSKKISLKMRGTPKS